MELDDSTRNPLIQDDENEVGIRPSAIDEFIGQEALKSNLKIYLNSAKVRSEPLDHVIFYGPPGLGKTTLSQIIAKEMGVNIKITSGPILSKSGDLAAILTNLQPKDVLFIDEIHRLPAAVEEVLYSAMEDFALDIMIGDGPSARSVRITLPKFTLVAATTRLGLLSGPLKDRFGIPIKLDFYTQAELAVIIKRGAIILGVDISEEAANKLAICSRGTPRIALRLLKRARDFAVVASSDAIDLKTASSTLTALGVDDNGLDKLDYKYIEYIEKFYNNGPVGIDTIAAGIAEDKQTIEDIIEPYLMQIGLLHRTPKGRVIAKKFGV